MSDLLQMSNETLWDLGTDRFYARRGTLLSLVEQAGYKYMSHAAEDCELDAATMSYLNSASIKVRPAYLEVLSHVLGYPAEHLRSVLLGSHCTIPRWHHLVPFPDGEGIRGWVVEGTMYCGAPHGCNREIARPCPATCKLPLCDFRDCPSSCASCSCHLPTSELDKARFLQWVRRRIRDLRRVHKERAFWRQFRNAPYKTAREGI